MSVILKKRVARNATQGGPGGHPTDRRPAPGWAHSGTAHWGLPCAFPDGAADGGGEARGGMPAGLGAAQLMRARGGPAAVSVDSATKYILVHAIS